MDENTSKFGSIISKAKACKKPMRVAVAGADVENILRGVFDAQALEVPGGLALQAECGARGPLHGWIPSFLCIPSFFNNFF